MFSRLLVQIGLCGMLFGLLAGIADAASTECGQWKRVGDSLMQEEGFNTTCWMNPKCTGFQCTGLSESMVAARLNRHINFEVEILPCTYPLSMSIRLEHWVGNHVNRVIDIHSTGDMEITLLKGPPLLGEPQVDRKLKVAWTFKRVPNNGQIELEIIYTAQTRKDAEHMESEVIIMLVPKFVVPVPNCPVDVIPTERAGTPKLSTVYTPQPSDITRTSYPIQAPSIKPLLAGIGLIAGILVLVCAVLIQRHWMALRLNRRSTHRHVKLVNEEGTDDWMPQV